MAVIMTGQSVLPTDRQTVWEKLNDPDVLKQCIPGCQTLEKAGDTGFAANVKVKVGPVSASFKGKVELKDLDPPTSCRIEGEGRDGIAGFAKGGAKVTLTEQAPNQTLLAYEVTANVGAKHGARLIDGVVKGMAEKFFKNFAAAVGAGGQQAA